MPICHSGPVESATEFHLSLRFRTPPQIVLFLKLIAEALLFVQAIATTSFVTNAVDSFTMSVCLIGT